MSARLTLRGLTRRHDRDVPPALDAVDLEVPAGSCVAVLGPSGSGKTTLLRMVAGLDAPDGGDVLLDGASVLGVAAERRGTSMVFQRPLLFPHLSVLDNVAFSARMAGRPRAAARREAAEHLDLVQLGGLGARRAHELSGGQAQRVALARALAAQPRVLLLDEPFSALDDALRADMHGLLDRLRAALQPTVVLVTHDQDEAATLADTVAVLDRGRLLQHGTVDDLYDRPASVRVSRLTGGRNELPGVVRGGRVVSALGAWDCAAADGPAVLLVRQEAVQLVATEGARAVGEVTARRRVGARLRVEVTLPDGSLLHAEPPLVRDLRTGDRVGIAVETRAVTVVPPD